MSFSRSARSNSAYSLSIFFFSISQLPTFLLATLPSAIPRLPLTDLLRSRRHQFYKSRHNHAHNSCKCHALYNTRYVHAHASYKRHALHRLLYIRGCKTDMSTYQLPALSAALAVHSLPNTNLSIKPRRHYDGRVAIIHCYISSIIISLYSSTKACKSARSFSISRNRSFASRYRNFSFISAFA